MQEPLLESSEPTVTSESQHESSAFSPSPRQPYKQLNYRWPDREFVRFYKKPGRDRFNEAALSFRSLGSEKINFSKRFEMVICAVFLFVPRIVVFTILFLLKIALTKLIMIGLPNQNRPYTTPQVVGWRRALFMVGLVLLRGWYLCFGILWVESRGKRASQKEAPIRVFAPHTGWLDTIVHCDWPITDPLHPVVNDSMKAFPIITPTEPLFVDRTTADAKKFMKECIIQRATYQPKDPNGRRWDPIMINPQGCCSAACLTNFKTGAFSAGLPVQPVYMEYPEKIDLYSWQWIDGNKNHSPLKALMLGFLRYRCKLICHYLDVYYPSQAEIDDPQLYAHNVRAVLAEHSKLPIIDTCFEDTIFLDKLGSKYKLDPNYCLIEYLRLRNTYSELNSRKCMAIIEQYLDKYLQKLDDKKTAEVSFANFVKLVGQPMSVVDDYFRDLRYFNADFVSLPTVLEAELRWLQNGRSSFL